jgi:hypothetical protein
LLKLVYCICRKPSLSREEFSFYWLNHHATLVSQHAASTGAYRYVQSHTVDLPVTTSFNAARGITNPVYDGVTEFWWLEESDLLPPGISKSEIAAAQQKLLEDEKAFIDLERSVLFMTEEHVIFDRADYTQAQ